MVILGLAFVSIMCVNVLNEIAALTLLRGADFASVLGQPPTRSYGDAVPRFASLRVHYRLDLWPLAFLFGVLVFKSGFLPRILGVLLIAACFGYLADSLTPLLLPSYRDIVSRIANIALTLGEPVIILWLLIRGAKDQPLPSRSIK